MSFLRRQLYDASKRCFDQKKRANLKRWVTWSRKRFGAAYIAVHGRFTARDLVTQLRGMISEEFDVLMVHSAHDRLLPMYIGTVQELLDELITYCGPHRTLAMPTFILGAPDYDPIRYYRRYRTFDVKRSISEMGLLSEAFRRRPGVRRSRHPTHSVSALGPLAAELTATHHLATTRAGKDSPFDIMAKRRTAVIGIGVEYYRSLTQAKSVEDIMDDAYPVPCSKEAVDVRMIDEDGAESVYPLTVRTFAGRFRGSILRSLMTRDELIDATFHGVPLWKTTAKRTTECVLAAAYKGITLYGNVRASQRSDETAPLNPGRSTEAGTSPDRRSSAVTSRESTSLDPHLR